MVVYPFLMNNDFSLYTDLIMPYQPAFPVFLEFFSRIFGYQPLPYQILTWFLIILTDILIFLITKKISGKISLAFCALVFFSIISIPFGVNGLWFDLVQTPFIILSCYFFYLYLKNPQKSVFLFYSFLFASVAFFIKQQIIWLIFAYIAVIFFTKKTGNILKLSFQLLTPLFLFLTVGIFLSWQKNSLENFIYWTLYFPFIKSSTLPGYISLPNVKQIIIIFALFMFFLPTIFQKRSRKNIFFIFVGFVLLLFAYPRFDYFHLIPSLSILSLLAGENIKNALSSKNSILKAVFFFSLIFLLVITIRFILKNQIYETRFFERDIYTAASFIERITDQKDLIYIQNGPDQIMPIAQRLPPKPWADEFPWYLEIPQVQERIIKGLIESNPGFIIYKPYDIGNKYKLGVYRPTEIASYIEKNYKDVIKITDTLWLRQKK